MSERFKKDMLYQLQFSMNNVTAIHANNILFGRVSETQARAYGGFMNAVLDGTYELALKLADSDNLECLHRIAD